MRMRKFILIGALVLLASFNAKARIGYTLDECIKQYGSITDHGHDLAGDNYSFHAGTYSIDVWMFEGKVARILYFPPGFFSSFSDEEFKQLRNKNGGGRVWVEDEPGNTYHVIAAQGLSGLHAEKVFSGIAIYDDDSWNRRNAAEYRLNKEKEAAKKAAKKAAFDTL